MVRKSYRPIPNKMIAEGVLLSLANAKRYVKNAESLHLQGGDQTALLCLFLAAEEFSKANLLFGHFLKDTDVPSDRVATYFKSHPVKLEEFYKFLYSHSFVPMDWSAAKVAEFSKEKGFSEQTFNQRYITTNAPWGEEV